MNKNTDIYSVEYYLAKAVKPGKKTSLMQRAAKKTNFKILVQDHIKDSVYLVDA